MPSYKHSLDWVCLLCSNKTHTEHITTSRDLEVYPKTCAGALVSHRPTDMAWSNHRVEPIIYAQGGPVGPYAPGKANMTSSFGALDSWLTDPGLRRAVTDLHTPKASKAAVKAKEQADIAQKIIVGDVIQLVSKAGAVLQGEVLAVRRVHGRHGAVQKVRIKGFDHVGGEAGGHHVYWPLAEFDVEILIEAYRLTDEDRAVAVLSGYGEEAFRDMAETRRQALRSSYGAKARRVAEILNAQRGEGG